MENIMSISPQKKRIHPYKFTLWVAMASVIMMFAGFTSAYIVKRNQVNWQGFDLPVIFWYSTGIIVISSITIQLALRNFKQRRFVSYRQLIIITAVLGIAFCVMQLIGFGQVNDKGIKLVGRGSNVAGSFLAVIAGMHILHVLGGIVAIFIMLAKSLRRHTRSYDAVPIEVMSTYWHFVDFLWIYLFAFMSMVN